MKFFKCSAFDVEYVVLADNISQALQKLKAEPGVAAIVKEYEDEGTEIAEKDFSAHPIKMLTEDIGHLEDR